MKKAHRNFWIVTLCCGVFFVVCRLLATPALRYVINRQINQAPGISGGVEDISLDLWRLSYRVAGIHLRKAADHEVKDAFLKVHELRGRMHGAPLWQGVLEGEVAIVRPAITIETQAKRHAKTSEEKTKDPIRVQKEAVAALRRLMPFKVATLSVEDGVIAWRDVSQMADAQVTLQHLDVAAHNITNRSGLKDAKYATIHATAQPLGHGRLVADLQVDPLAQFPTFDLSYRMQGINLARCNAFLKPFTQVDIARGELAVFAEAAARDGYFKGYVKPIVTHLKVRNDADASLGERLLKTALNVAADLVKSKSHEQIASKIPIEGKFKDPDVSVGEAILTLFENGFTQALLPQLDNSVALSDVETVEKK